MSTDDNTTIDSDIIPTNPNPLNLPNSFLSDFQENIFLGLSSLNDKNEEEYKSTYRMWSGFSWSIHNNPANLDPIHVFDYLTDNSWSFSTRSVRLAHLRKYAEIIALTDNDNEHGYASNWERLKLIKPKALGGEKNVLEKTILSRRQIYTVFDAWQGESNKNTRNRAILGLMLLAGLRSSEIISLRWKDIDFKKGTIFISEGKGGKSAHIPTLADLPKLLSEWNTVQNATDNYDFVCVHIFRSDKIANNSPVSTYTISKLCKDTQFLTGIKFNPHDARRTAITELLSNGATLPETRDFARHASGQTTMLYAAPSDATTLGKSLADKLSYGDVLGATGHSEKGRYWECGFNHSFFAHEPEKCPICGNVELTHQISMFDDEGKK